MSQDSIDLRNIVYRVEISLIKGVRTGFTSQIAHMLLVMIRYNLLASIKWANDYETMGGLFADIYSGVQERTVIEKI